MNLLTGLLTPERVRIDLETSARGRLFELAGRLFAAYPGLDEARVVESLEGREKLGSTGVGQGVALPHARVKGLREPLAAFVRLRLPIPFDAPDGKPVSLVFILLVPEHATEAHLQLLAEAAQMFCDRRFREQLRQQTDVAGVIRAFADWPAIPA